MGKTTRFHPVSLYVIRGALDYGGIRVNRIRQESLINTEVGSGALYITEVIETRGEAMGKAFAKQNFAEYIESLFSDDVHVVNFWETKSGKKMLEFSTFLPAKEEPANPSLPESGKEVTKMAQELPLDDQADLDWLNDQPEREDPMNPEPYIGHASDGDDLPFTLGKSFRDETGVWHEL